MEYLRSKWTFWFKSLDANHDDNMTIEDMKQSIAKFDDIQKHIGEKNSAAANFDHTKWWNTYIFRKGPGVEMKLEEFLQALEESYSNDKDAFRQEIKRCFQELSVFIADKMDRPISEEEFTFGFKVFGQGNAGQVGKAYQLFKSIHGHPTVDQIVDAWVQFITDDDESRQDIIYEVFGHKTAV